ncbi:MAG: hypothetical protein ACPG14_05525 [Flavobacteriaceae bacterium]
MKKLLLILSLICFISCTVDDCVVITRKENIGDTFLFFFEDDRNPFSVTNQTVVDEYGAIPSGAVTEEVFNQYEVGDTYCID